MQTLQRLIIILFVPLCLLASCTKENIAAGSDAKSSVYFIYSANSVYTTAIDSLNYSFVEKASTVTMDTVWLSVRASGLPADHDRAIKISAVASKSTAVAGVHYKLLSYVMPKDSIEASLGVVMLRDPSLQDTSVSLALALETSSDFPVSMKDTLMGDGKFITRNNIVINITDRLIKPSNWDSYLINFFGTYSDVKYRFIAGVLGRSSFLTTGDNKVNFPQMQFYQNTVRNALVDYTAAHGPLIDENGNVVVIP